MEGADRALDLDAQTKSTARAPVLFGVGVWAATTIVAAAVVGLELALAAGIAFLALAAAMLVARRDRAPQAMSRADEADSQGAPPALGTDVIDDADVFGVLAAREMSRARRYERPLAVVSISVESPTPARAPSERDALARSLALVLRETDYVARLNDERILLMLPETSFEAAQALTQRAGAAVGGDVARRLRVGVASFPADEVTGIALHELAVERGAAAEAGGGRS